MREIGANETFMRDDLVNRYVQISPLIPNMKNHDEKKLFWVQSTPLRLF